MASYYRDSERLDSALPAIRNRGGELAGSGGRLSRIDLIDEDDAQRRVRFASQVHSSSTSSLNREFPRDSREFYPRPPSPTCQSRKQVLELQDQLRLYKDELANKESLITQLSSVQTPRSKHIDVTYSKIDESFSSDRVTALANARSEAATLQVKLDGLLAQLREVKSQLESREDKIRELKMEVELARENEAKHVAIAHSLQQRLVEFESTAGQLEGAASRTEVVISSLKREKDEANSRILQLESRLRTYMEDREAVEQKMRSCEGKYQDIMAQVTSVLSVEDISMGSSVGELVAKLKEMVQDNAALRDKMGAMNEYVRSADVENKASRETILRLVSETEKGQGLASRYNMDIGVLKQERDHSVSRMSEYEHEVRLLKERLEASQNAWAATRKELGDKELKYNHYTREVRESEMLVRGHETALRSFKEELAGLLSDGCCVIDMTEESIRDRLKTLIHSLHDRSSHITLLESKVSTMTEQLDKQFELQKSADRRAKRVEGDYLELESNLRRQESELASQGALRDGMRSDKENYLRFLEMCCRALKLDVIAGDIGFDLSMDAIIGRAEQLVKMEGDALSERQTHIYNLQRKVKALKEQLESRDLHIDLLRKKVAALEERLVGKTEIEREKDTEAVKSKKLMKLVEKYKREVQEAHFEIREMKATLLGATEYRNRTLEAENHVGSLASKVDQLEKVRQKQAHRIASLKDNIETTTSDISNKTENANHTIQALTRELRTTKLGLEECTKREKQLLDLRQVVARMLGLDMNVLAVPDYEIISRLEKLILANQSSVATTAAIDGALVDMEDGFREGYQDPGRVYVRARSPVRKVTTLRTRTRSLSPSRRKDNRVY